MKGVLPLFLLFLTSCAATTNFGFGNPEPTTPAATQAQPPQSSVAAPFTPNLSQTHLCGDGSCSGIENECNCPKDCGACENKTAATCIHYTCTALQACVPVTEFPCCGDSSCDSGESCSSCMADCCNITKTLADFPKLADHLIFVVGRNAPAADVVTAANLAAALKQLKVGIGQTLLDSEVVDIDADNYVVIGSPCVNAIAAQLLDITKHKNPCSLMSNGEGQIRLIATSDHTIALVVTGGSSADVNRAAKRLLTFQQSPLVGTLVKT